MGLRIYHIIATGLFFLASLKERESVGKPGRVDLYIQQEYVFNLGKELITAKIGRNIYVTTNCDRSRHGTL